MTPTARACRALLAFFLLPGACGALAFVGASPAQAALARAEEPRIVVTLAGQPAPVTLRWSDIQSDIGSVEYDMRYEDGGRVESRDFAQAFVSARRLVETLGAQSGTVFSGIDPSSVTYMTVRAPGSSAVRTLERPSFGPVGQNGFTQFAPAFFLNTDQLGYVRPLRVDEPRDVNGRDLLPTAASRLDVTISTSGKIVRPRITATPSPARVDELVRFRASFDDPPPDLTYAWDFDGDDITDSTDPSPSHRYSRTSRSGYPVRLTVEGSDRSTGGATTEVVVTPADPPPPSPTEVKPRITLSPQDPDVGQEVRFSLDLGGPGRLARATWRLTDVGEDAPRRVSEDAGFRHTFAMAGSATVLVETVSAGGDRESDALTVTVGAAPGNGSGGGPTNQPGGSNPDPAAPTNGPDDGTGAQPGGSTDPGAPTGGSTAPAGREPAVPGGLTGILLTGASTPVDVVPLPDSQAAAEQQAAAAAARARTEAGGESAGGTIRWGLGIVPLLLLVGVVREAGGWARLRSSWARAMMSR